MGKSTSKVPMAGTRSGPFSDVTDEHYRSTLRYLGAIAHAEAGVASHASPTEENLAPGAAVPNVPEFVRDVMVTGVVAAHAGALFKEIVDALVRNHISAVPVVDAQRRVVGVVSESDLLARVSGGRLARPRGHRLSAHTETKTKLHAATAGELMTAPAVVCTPDTSIADAARKAADTRVRRLPVIDANGVLIGIVTRADLLRPFLRPDTDIQQHITQVIATTHLLTPEDVAVTVEEGVVKLQGQIERKLLRDALVESTRAVAGVIDVDDAELSYRYDDSLRVRPTLY